MKNKYLYRIVVYSAIVGIILAIYQLYEQVTRPVWTPCYVNSVVNCNAIISGAVSKTFGIPTPAIGLTGYVVILWAAWKERAKFLLGMATFGLAFCAWIGYQEIFLLHTICPVCILCQVDMITVFLFSIWITANKRG